MGDGNLPQLSLLPVDMTYLAFPPRLSEPGTRSAYREVILIHDLLLR